MEHLDEIFGIVLPFIVYWAYSGFYELVGSLESFQKYKIHSMEQEKMKNKVTRGQVVKGVLISQAFQSFIVLLSYLVSGGVSSSSGTNKTSSILVLVWQFLVAMVVFDTHMYFIHKLEHENKFLFRHLHSRHHQIVVPWAFGSQYGHPLEVLINENLAGVLGFLASGMSHRASVVFFTFATIKGVDDHCGMRLPWNPLHYLFGNNAMYHDIHHQPYGHKYNYSQPFFVMWDKLMGTYMPYSLEKRPDGSFVTRPAAAAAAAAAVKN